MPPFPVRKILFDLDGTLVDSAPDLHAATNHVLRHIGRAEVNLDQVRDMVGYGALRLIELGLEATGGREGYDAEDLRPIFLDYYRDNITNHTVLFEGAADMLFSLRDKGFMVGLCTNKPVALAHPILENLRIGHHFSAVTGGDSFRFKKPDPRHLFETARQIPGEGPILMVGDSRPDIDAARAANIPSIAVSFGYSSEPVDSLGASHVIDNLSELTNLVTLS